MKKTKGVMLIIAALLAGVTVSASAADYDLKHMSFEEGVDGLGIVCSSNDMRMPALYSSGDIAVDGEKSAELVAGSTVTGEMYQGVVLGRKHQSEKNALYITRANVYTSKSGVKARVLLMNGSKIIRKSDEYTINSGSWNYICDTWLCDKVYKNLSVRVVFYNVAKNTSIYIDDVSCYTDLMLSNGFESGYEDWQKTEGLAADVSTDKYVKGEKSLKITVSPEMLAEGAAIWQNVSKAKTDSAMNVISAYVYSETDETYAQLYIENAPQFSRSVALKSGWNYIQTVFDTSEISAQDLTIKLKLQGESGSAADFYIDEVRIRDEKSIVYVDKSADETSISVSGTLRKGNENNSVTVNIIDDKTGATVLSGSTAVQADGTYTKVFSLDEISEARMTMRIKVDGALFYDEYGNEITGSYEYVNGGMIDGYLSQINNAPSAESVKTIMTTPAVVNALNLKAIDVYRNNPNPDVVYKIVYETSIGSIEDLEAAVKVGSALDTINGAGNKFIEMLDTFKSELKLGEALAYERLYKTVDKAKLTANFYEKSEKVDSLLKLRQRINEAIIKTVIRTHTLYSQTMETLKEYDDEIALNFTAYDSISDSDKKYNVAVNFAKYAVECKDFALLQAKLNELVNNGGNSGSGGSGGGGGGGGSSNSGKTDNGSFAVGLPAGASNNTNSGSDSFFNDLKGCEWAEDSINILVKRNIISKADDKKYRPNDSIKREEFSKLIAEAFSFETGKDGGFSDVDNTMWYAKYINSLAEAGILTGFADGRFGVGEKITRQDVCVIIHRVAEKRSFGLEDKYPQKQFKDGNQISEYAKAAVEAMTQAGIVNGYEDGTFKPNAYITRAEAAKLLAKIITEFER